MPRWFADRRRKEADRDLTTPRRRSARRWRGLVMLVVGGALLSGCGGEGAADQPPSVTISSTPIVGHASPNASLVASPLAVGGPTSSLSPPTGSPAACAASADDAAAEEGTASLVVVAALNLRAGPGTGCPVVGSMGFGTLVTVFPDEVPRGDQVWRRLRAPQGDGFAIADAIQPLPPPEEAAIEVPVLMYHHIAKGPDRFFVPPAELEAQMTWLHANGYVSITPTDLYNAIFADLPLPAKPVIISVDDGNKTDPLFAKILDKYGFRGTYFWHTGAALSEEQIAALAQTGEACAHTVNHLDLTTLSVAEQRIEIVDNKLWLERIIGKPVACFGFPFGASTAETEVIIDEAGFLLGFDAWGPPAPLATLARWHVPRIEIAGGSTIEQFVDQLLYGTGDG